MAATCPLIGIGRKGQVGSPELLHILSATRSDDVSETWTQSAFARLPRVIASQRHCLFGIGLLRQNNPTGKFSLPPSGKSPLRLTPSCPRGRGVGHRHERWDGMRWTRWHRARDGMAGRASRYMQKVLAAER